MRVLSTILAAALAGALAACAAPVGAGAADDGGGCAPGERSLELEHGGRTRSALVVLPAGAKRLPAVLALHGGYGTGEHMRKMSGLDAYAERGRFVAVYPDGWRRAWNAGDCCGPPHEQKVDDAAFLLAVADRLAAEGCVDASRIYAMGISNGAGMVHALACAAPQRVAAIAMVAGAQMTQSCKVPLVPTLVIRGTADSRMPWAGGTVDGRAKPSTDESIRRLREQGGCGAERRESYRKAAATCWTWPGCARDARLELCRIEGGGHAWPGGGTRLFSEPEAQAGLSATRRALEFFGLLPRGQE